MKLDSKTLKYIMYASIVIFFLILIGQYINPPDIEGLTNKEKEDQDDENSQVLQSDMVTQLTAINQKENKISGDEAGMLSSLRALTEEEKIYLPGMMTPYLVSSTPAPFNTSDISGLATSFTNKTQQSLIDISQNIANMKNAAKLDTRTGMNQAGYIIDRLIEQTRLMGINILLNPDVTGRFGTLNIFLEPFIKNYKSNMDTLQDLKAYTEGGGNSGGPAGLFSSFMPSAPQGGGPGL